MRRHLFVLVILALPLCIRAQEKPKDLIKFNGGARVHGIIKEYVEGQYMIVNVGGEDVRIEGGHFDEIKDIKFGDLNYERHTRGMWYEFDFGLNFGKSNSWSGTESYPSLHLISGYQFNQFVGLGLGTGFQSLSNVNIIPTYATFRGDIFDTRIAPFYYVDAGYGFGVNKDDDIFFGDEVDSKGGLMFSPGLGVRFKLKKIYLTTSLGYKLQKASVERRYDNVWWGWSTSSIGPPSGEEIYNEKRTYKRVEFRIGIGF
ncbi:MAG: hypothetical protein RJQ09_12485 [Cyclobacteriaceae bacterium]